jgi:sugar phosphate isomerase/epimerase
MPRFGLATLNHSPLFGRPTEWQRHLDAAAEAGFDALAPDVFWLRALEAEGLPLEQLARGLEDRGLACMELAGIAIGTEEQTRPELEEALRHAEILGAEFVNARLVEAPGRATMDQLCRCAEALARVGTRVALEFSNGTQLAGVADTRVFIETAGAEGVGVTLDTWHFFLARAVPLGREVPDWESFEALPLSLLANVQLSDGVDYGEGSFRDATMNERRVPGEGEFDLAGVAQRLRSKGFDGAVIVEVLNARLRGVALEAFAREVAVGARRWWETGAGVSGPSNPGA